MARMQRLLREVRYYGFELQKFSVSSETETFHPSGKLNKQEVNKVVSGRS